MPGNDQVASQRRDNLGRFLVHQVFSPLVGSTIAVAFATGRWDLSALGTGLAITGTLALFWRLDRAFIYPHLKRIPQDWLRMETEMFVSVFGHLMGALLALIACGYISGFEVAPTASWLLLIGIIMVFPILHGAEMAVDYYRQLREKERVEQELRTLATQAELKALKAQINPHFFFNALNTIAALIHTDPALAEASVERLAQMFRYVLAGSERGQVALEAELAFVDDYLEIERARFGRRLRVTREIDPQALSLPVPSLILQPLVENAVKHGHGDDGHIDLDIRVEATDSGVRIIIADQGPRVASRLPDRRRSRSRAAQRGRATAKDVWERVGGKGESTKRHRSYHSYPSLRVWESGRSHYADPDRRRRTTRAGTPQAPPGRHRGRGAHRRGRGRSPGGGADRAGTA